MEYNIYCDESCHLENDNSNVMVLGAIWCPAEKAKVINKRIREFKQKYGLSESYELKWTKISTNHFSLYLDIVDYFFDQDNLHFRAVVIPDKSLLNHDYYGQTHDEWYYKMMFTLLNNIWDPSEAYRIFLDYKDTQGGKSIKKLQDVLRNNYYDFSRTIIKDINLVQSEQVGLIQLTDIFTGALCAANKSFNYNEGKNKIIQRIKSKSGYSLKQSTLLKAKKINLLIWRPSSKGVNFD